VSRRTLQRIDSLLHERTAFSRKPDKLMTQELAALHDTERMPRDLLMCDPYVLGFLGLQDTYLEQLRKTRQTRHEPYMPDTKGFINGSMGSR
jgi:predicted nuclease of restriction endonuclease-like (RecB) superfamily